MSMLGGFTRSFREELARVEEGKLCCRMALMSGLLHTSGIFLIKGGVSDDERYEVRFSTTVLPAAKIVYSQFKAFGSEGNLLTHREQRLKQRLVYEVHIKGSPATIQALNEMGTLSDSFQLEQGVARRLVKKVCCKSAFVRGCLLGSGSANAPQREAHLEIVTEYQGFADDLAGLLRDLEFHPGQRQRRGGFVVYLKGRDEVAGLLALAGAHESALFLEELAVVKEVRSQANRLVNCDEANSRRTSAASSRQLEAIAILREKGKLAALPPALQEMVDLRLRYPYMNLAELGEVAGGLSKSAINHRLRRIVTAAESCESCSR